MSTIPTPADPAFYLHRLDMCRCGKRRGDHEGAQPQPCPETGCAAFRLAEAHDPRARSLEAVEPSPDWAEFRRVKQLADAAAKANEALERIGEQASERIIDLAGWLRYALENWAPSGSDKAEAARASLERAEAETPATPTPRAQHDPGAHIIMREAVDALREQRDAHGNKADPYDKLTVAARNLRDAFEWLWPLLWRDDPEFVPFAERRRT